jgi:hypothetical protein
MFRASGRTLNSGHVRLTMVPSPKAQSDRTERRQREPLVSPPHCPERGFGDGSDRMATGETIAGQGGAGQCDRPRRRRQLALARDDEYGTLGAQSSKAEGNQPYARRGSSTAVTTPLTRQSERPSAASETSIDPCHLRSLTGAAGALRRHRTPPVSPPPGRMPRLPRQPGSGQSRTWTPTMQCAPSLR